MNVKSKMTLSGITIFKINKVKRLKNLRLYFLPLLKWFVCNLVTLLHLFVVGGCLSFPCDSNHVGTTSVTTYISNNLYYTSTVLCINKVPFICSKEEL